MEADRFAALEGRKAMTMACRNLPWIALLALSVWACSPEETEDADAKRERDLEQMMSNVRLVGGSTGFDREKISGQEEYVIEKVSHLTGDRWLFQTTLKIGSREIPVPIPVTVLWAGDTPVLTLTDLSIPGLGTYSARVLLFRDHYSGTWMGGEEGGYVFGEIVRRERQ